MNVTESNNITNTIKDLRQNIYGNDLFKVAFSSELEDKLYAYNTRFIPEQFGGWVVDMSINRTKSIESGIDSQNSELYVQSVSDALYSAIDYIDKLEAENCRYLIPNLFNVIVTGPSSIAVKI